jgi:hypothetical protein
MTNSRLSEEHAMTDPYDITQFSPAPQTKQAKQAGDKRGGLLRPLLWLGLVVSGAVNIVTSSMDINVLIGIGFGLVALSCGVALIVDHYRNRRS